MGCRRALAPLAQDLPLVNIDAVLIERVLCNLLDNAAKYSPEGTVIDLAARRVDHAVEISVTDRGSGFKSSNPADLFRMFVRGRSESSATGTGLGLAICKSIIDAHGGTIFAEDCQLRATSVVSVMIWYFVPSPVRASSLAIGRRWNAIAQ